MYIPPVYEAAQSIDAAKVDIVVEEIKKLGGDGIGVTDDVAADDFPKKIVDATVRKYGKINHIVNIGKPIISSLPGLKCVE